MGSELLQHGCRNSDSGTLRNFPPMKKNTAPACSVVVVCRNEVLRLPALLESVTALLVYRPEWEVVWVDDHSSDGTTEMLREWAGCFPRARVVVLPEHQGKKRGILAGAAQARHPYLWFTDADCRFETAIANVIETHMKAGTDLVAGVVDYSLPRSVLHHWVLWERNMLLAPSLQGNKSNRLTLCNGANLLVRKKWVTTETYTGNLHVPTGDDIFLLQYVHSQEGMVRFEKDLLVQTLYPDNLTHFIKQRIRWASKMLYYRDKVLWMQMLLLLTLLVIWTTAFTGAGEPIVLVIPPLLFHLASVWAGKQMRFRVSWIGGYIFGVLECVMMLVLLIPALWTGWRYNRQSRSHVSINSQ